MSSTWELKQWNVWVDQLKIKYKIVLKAVTPVQTNVYTGIVCPLRVTVHRAAY